MILATAIGTDALITNAVKAWEARAEPLAYRAIYNGPFGGERYAVAAYASRHATRTHAQREVDLVIVQRLPFEADASVVGRYCSVDPIGDAAELEEELERTVVQAPVFLGEWEAHAKRRLAGK